MSIFTGAGVAIIAISFTKMKKNSADIGNVVRIPISQIKSNIVSHPDRSLCDK